MYFAMLVSLWQLMISILILVLCSLGNSNPHKLTGVPVRPMDLLLDDDGQPGPIIRDPPPPSLVDWVDGVGVGAVHAQDRMNNGMIAEAGAIQSGGCSPAGQTKKKQLSSDIDGHGHGKGDTRNIASRNTAEQEGDGGHQNGEACRNIGAMSDVQLIPLSDLDAIIEADTIGPEPNPEICENSQRPIPVCAPDQITEIENYASQIPRCRPCKLGVFTSTPPKKDLKNKKNKK